MTRDTVWVETPAAEATSLIVARPDLWSTVIDPVIVPVIDNRIGHLAYPVQVTNVMTGLRNCRGPEAARRRPGGGRLRPGRTLEQRWRRTRWARWAAFSASSWSSAGTAS